jgi:hypothetical protein
MLRPEHPLSITPEAPHEQPPYDVTGAWVLDSGGLILPPGADTAIVNPFDRAESHPGIVTPDTLDQLPPNLTAWTSPVGELCVPPINGDGERPTTIQIVEELPPELVPDTDKDKSQAVDTYIWLSRPQAALRIFATETGNGQAQRLLGFLGDWEHRPHEIEPISDDTEKQEIAHEVDKFIAGVVRETALLLTKRETATDTLRVVTDLVDTVRFETKSAYLDCPETAATVAEVALERPEVLNSAVVNLLLKKIEIPPSVAGDLLGLMDRTGQLKQPLAWRLLDKLPDDHPFKDEQRTRVEDLKTVLTGNISPEQLSKAKELAKTIISVYVDPEEAGGVMVGLELEALSRIDAVGVPEGTGVGFDSGTKSTPEVRLINAKHILKYGKDWRKRYHDLHTWTGLTQALRQSLHIHIDRSESTSPKLYRRLFGLDGEDLRENGLGTMEIRTALANYTKVQKPNPANMTERGFSSEYMPELVELAISLRELDLAEDPSGLFGGKPEEVLGFVDDPTARAAMMVVLSSSESKFRLPFHSSEWQEKLVDAAIERNKLHKLLLNFDIITDPIQRSRFVRQAMDVCMSELCANLTAIADPEQKALIIDAALERSDIDAINGLILSLDYIVDVEQQARLIDAALQNRLIESLIYKLNFIADPDVRFQVIEIAIEEGWWGDLIENFDAIINLQQRARVVDGAIEEHWFVDLVENIDVITDPEQRTRIIDTAIDEGGGLVDMLVDNFADIPESEQNRVIEVAIKDKKIEKLINNLGSISDPEQQAAVIEAAIDQNRVYQLSYKLDIIADPEQQARVIDASIKFNSIDGLTSCFGSIASPEQRKKVVEFMFKKKAEAYLIDSLDAITDPEQRARVIEALIVSEDPEDSLRVLEVVSDYGCQSRIVERFIESGWVSFVARKLKDISSPELQDVVIEAFVDEACRTSIGHIANILAYGDLPTPLRMRLVSRVSSMQHSDPAQARVIENNSADWAY